MDAIEYAVGMAGLRRKEAMANEIGIGSSVWVYDENSRVYRRDQNGHPYGSPIERCYWRLSKIVGETRVSWILSSHCKIPKKNPNPRRYLFSEEDVNRVSWIAENRVSVSDAVRRLDDYDLLKRVAGLIGYEGKGD